MPPNPIYYSIIVLLFNFSNVSWYLPCSSTNLSFLLNASLHMNSTVFGILTCSITLLQNDSSPRYLNPSLSSSSCILLLLNAPLRIVVTKFGIITFLLCPVYFSILTSVLYTVIKIYIYPKQCWLCSKYFYLFLYQLFKFFFYW